MRGLDALVSMRRRGSKPALVFLDDFRDQSHLKAWRDWPVVSPSCATLQLDDGDRIERLDLRALIGMTVVISSHNHERLLALEAAVSAAGAKEILSAHLHDDGATVLTSHRRDPNAHPAP